MPIRVLIVDDNPEFRKTASGLLRSRGYIVAGEAGSREEALAAMSDLHPDAVLLDVHLPEGDGLALAGELLPDGEDARVLLTSSDDGAATDELAEQRGAVGFVPKSELAVTDLGRYFSTAREAGSDSS